MNLYKYIELMREANDRFSALCRDVHHFYFGYLQAWISTKTNGSQVPGRPFPHSPRTIPTVPKRSWLGDTQKTAEVEDAE